MIPAASVGVATSAFSVRSRNARSTMRRRGSVSEALWNATPFGQEPGQAPDPSVSSSATARERLGGAARRPSFSSGAELAADGRDERLGDLLARPAGVDEDERLATVLG